jgi:peptidoglycan hydrolase-like protein with peptidoglycan-binding domain
MNNGPTLSQGSTGADVKRLQRLFVMMKTASVEAIDGIFGRKTKAVIIDFPQDNGLVADGILGNQTWSKLPADPNTPLLKRGASGDAVTGLQTACANSAVLVLKPIPAQWTVSSGPKPRQPSRATKPS